MVTNQKNETADVNMFPAASNSEDVLSYVNPAGSEYPVICYNNVVVTTSSCPAPSNPSDQQMNPEYYNNVMALLNTVQDCGFNVNLWSNIDNDTDVQILTKLSVAEYLELPTFLCITNKMPTFKKLGNGQVISDLSGFPAVLNRYADCDALAGFLMKDEPGYMTWNPKSFKNEVLANAKAIDLVGAYDVYRENDNGRIAYFNLAASVAEGFVGSKIANSTDSYGTKYLKYLEAIQEKVNPVMLSVDIYPVYQDQNYLNQGKTGIREHYYPTLEAMGTFSKESGIPMWLYMLSNSHKIYKENGGLQIFYPTPTEGMLRFQAMTALAYGIQGLVFWTYELVEKKYYDRETKTKLHEEYLDAPYVNGRKTDIWTYCHNVIPDIKRLGQVLLGAKFKGARHVFGMDYPQAEIHKLGQIQALIGPFECIKNAICQGNTSGVVITHLTKGSGSYKRDYMAIVNHNPDKRQRIFITISDEYIWRRVTCTSDDIPLFSFQCDERNVEYQLQPGEMILIGYRHL